MKGNFDHKFEDSKPPSLKEVQEIIKDLKDKKAPGDDSIIVEMLKTTYTGTIEKHHRLYESIWGTENIQEYWETAIIHPVHKKRR